jgi:hypothetical protein
LVVDDFGVSYSKQQDVDHLIATLKANNYLLTIKEDGNTYLGMKIRFDTGKEATETFSDFEVDVIVVVRE